MTPVTVAKVIFLTKKVELTPADIEFVKNHRAASHSVKGILRGEDAVVAIDAGADAIRVSNHGGRQIDGVPSAISQLQEVAARVGHKVPSFLTAVFAGG